MAKQKETKQSTIQRLFVYAEKYKYLTIASWILATISAFVALVPFYFIWRIIKEVLRVAPNYADAENLSAYGWSAVGFAILSMLIYIGALICSHLSAFRVQANIRVGLMKHILTLPLGFMDEEGSGKVRKVVNESSAATETYLAHQLPDKCVAVATPIGLAILLFLFDWRLGLLCLIPVGLAFLVMGSMMGENMKKKIFTIFFVIAIAGGFLFTFAPGWLSFLIFFIISRIGYAACNIFYDAMLIDITTDERMDRVSTCGYAFGYIGSCIPFVAGLLLILNCDTIGLPMVTATRISFVITMVWWIIMSIPLYKNVHQQYSLPHEPHVFAATFKRLGASFQKLAKDKRMLFFIIGYFCYIDGVYTIISMATTYGGEVGIDSNAMVLALLLTQFVAFPCSILSGTLAKKFGSMRMIKIFIVMYMAICLFGYGLDTELEFWILAVSVGICQGGIQALSRSYYGKIIPKDESSEYFGFFDVFGKFADFFGPLIISFCAYFFHNSKYGVLSLILLFAVGLILITLSEKQPTAAE